jgi:hypothetical protein
VSAIGNSFPKSQQLYEVARNLERALTDGQIVNISKDFFFFQNEPNGIRRVCGETDSGKKT